MEGTKLPGMFGGSISCKKRVLLVDTFVQAQKSYVQTEPGRLRSYREKMAVLLRVSAHGTQLLLKPAVAW